MPAVSKKQRRAMAIAEHHPEKLYKRNKAMKKMSKKQLHEFAATKEKRLKHGSNYKTKGCVFHEVSNV